MTEASARERVELDPRLIAAVRECRIMRELCPEEWAIHGVPPLSTDETACFKWIVPAMKARGYRLLMQNLLYDNRVLVAFHTGLQESHEGNAPTAAEAVCRAALAYLDARKGEA